MHSCRNCHRADPDPVFDIERVPQDIQHLLTVDDLGKDLSTDFTIYQCKWCGLVQAPMRLGEDYYDDYHMTQTFSPKLRQYLDELVEHFLATHTLEIHSVLDVGCGDGVFMMPWQDRGISVQGIEPSDRSRAIAQQQGFAVEPGYMTAHTVIDSAPFDLFITRQVLEHVDDIHGFFLGIHTNTTAGAWGIIEVPRLEKAHQDLRFYDFFPDHVNYFSLDTLRSVCETHGFEVHELSTGMDDEYNIAIVRKRAPQRWQEMHRHRETLVRDLENLIVATPGGVAIWGAGAKGLSIMAAMRNNNIAMMVDSDPNKIGRYTPVSEQLVRDPADLMAGDVGAVVITAVAYQDRILAKLRAMDFSGSIYFIGAKGLIPQ